MVLAPGRSPRLVVDSSISIVTANTVLPNYMLPLGCFTVRFTFAILTLARVSLSVSPFFSPLSLRRGVVVVCFEVIRGELLCLSACAMWSRVGDPGWGIPGFRIVLFVLFPSPACMALCVSVFPPFFVFVMFMAILWWDDTMLSPLAWICQWTNWLPVIPLCVGFWFCFCFVLVVFVCLFVCFCLFWLLMMTAYWTMYRSFTSSLLWLSIADGLEY